MCYYQHLQTKYLYISKPLWDFSKQRKYFWNSEHLIFNHGCLRNFSSMRELFLSLTYTSNYIIFDILRLINSLLAQHEILRAEVNIAVKDSHFISRNSEFSSFYTAISISLESKVHVTSKAAQISSKCIQACGLACYRDKAVYEGQSRELRDQILVKQAKK